MPEDKELHQVQVNLAQQQRNALRDYFEIFVPSSIKLFLATRRKEDLDEVALSNATLFRYRFGFEATTPVRKQVIEFQNRYDLTDREVRLLRSGGQIRITRTELKVAPSWFMPTYGVVQMLILGAFCLLMALIVITSNSTDWRQSVAATVVFSIWGGGTWLLDNFLVRPWRILKGSGASSKSGPSANAT